MAGDLLLSAVLVICGVFGLVGSYGLLKLDDPMKRLHAPTKATTIGVGSALVASALHLWLTKGEASWQELLVIVFLFISAPVTAHFLAKAHLHRTSRPSDLPPTGHGTDWATFQPDRPVADASSSADPALRSDRASGTDG